MIIHIDPQPYCSRVTLGNQYCSPQQDPVICRHMVVGVRKNINLYYILHIGVGSSAAHFNSLMERGP